MLRQQGLVYSLAGVKIPESSVLNRPAMGLGPCLTGSPKFS